MDIRCIAADLLQDASCCVLVCFVDNDEKNDEKMAADTLGVLVKDYPKDCPLVEPGCIEGQIKL